MRVLQLISSIGCYGAEAAVLGLSEKLERLGCCSTLGVFVNAHSPNIEIGECAKRRGLKVEWIPCSGRMDYRTVRLLKSVIASRNIDVVHSHGYKSHLYALLSRRLTGCPVVATCHGHYSRGSHRRLPNVSDVKLDVYRAIEERVLRRVDRVVAVSAEMSRCLANSGVEPEKMTTIRNGVEIRTFTSALPAKDVEQTKSGRLAVGIIGRLIERKGHRELLQSAKEILGEQPLTVFFIVGDGPLRPILESLAHQMGIQSNVVFLGKRDDMPEVYAALDIVALPSLAEGTPMVILEALASKKAVIASQVGGIPEIICDAQTGCLVAPGNQRALRIGLLRLLRNSSLRHELGKNGQASVRQEYSLTCTAMQYLAEYRRATQSGVFAIAAAV